MKKLFRQGLLCASMLLPLVATAAAAQIRMTLFSGVNIPRNNFGAGTGISTSPGLGGGASLLYQIPGSRLQGGISLGAQQFSAKTESGMPKFTCKLLAVPVMLSAQYRLPTESFISYVGLEAGFCYTDYEIEDSGRSASILHGGVEVQPNAGLRFNATSNVDLDLNLGYQYVYHTVVSFGRYYSAADFTTIALRVGLGYSF